MAQMLALEVPASTSPVVLFDEFGLFYDYILMQNKSAQVMYVSLGSEPSAGDHSFALQPGQVQELNMTGPYWRRDGVSVQAVWANADPGFAKITYRASGRGLLGTPGQVDRIDIRSMGARPDGVFDCTAAIQQTFDLARETGREAYIPEGQWRTTAPIVWADSTPRISGAGYHAQIRPSSASFNWLEVGLEGDPGHPVPSGWVERINLRGPTVYSPVGDKAGIKILGAKWTRFNNIVISFAQIGIDPRGVAYGCSFHDIATFSYECNIGLLLRSDGTPGGGAGNDVPFINCRFSGGETGVWLEGQNGTYTFVTTLLGGGVNKPISDNRGCAMTSGASFDTWLATGGNATTSTYAPNGSCGAAFFGCSFEGMDGGWGLRHHGAGTDPSGVNWNIQGPTAYISVASNAIGCWKISGGYNDSVIMNQNAALGTFTSTVPCVYQGAGGASRPHFSENGTMGKLVSFAGVNRNLHETGMLARSSIPGHWVGMHKWMHNGLVFQRSGNDVHISTDYAATFLNKFVITTV